MRTRPLINAVLSALLVLLGSACADQTTSREPVVPQDLKLERNGQPKLACGMSTAEMIERKTTALAHLKKTMLERNELANGYSFKFEGNDTLYDEITAFVKAERNCCGFATYAIRATGPDEFMRLEITDPEGIKEFITTEMGL